MEDSRRSPGEGASQGQKKFLGHLITEREIEANSEKVEALQNMKTLQNTWEVQRLVDRITILF